MLRVRRFTFRTFRHRDCVSAQAPLAPPTRTGAGAQAGAVPLRPHGVVDAAFPTACVIPNRHTQVQQAERGILHRSSSGPRSGATQVLSCTCAIRSGAATARPRQVHWLVWDIPATEKDFPRHAEGAQLPTASAKSSQAALCIAARGRRPRDRCTTTRSRCTRSIRDRQAPGGCWEPAQSFQAMDCHVIGKAVMVGMFKRPQ